MTKADSSGDSSGYAEKKKFFAQLLTVYGRKPVLEALTAKGVEIYRLHLAKSNRSATILDQITATARSKGAEIVYHSREALSRISKNKKQDQGVAADVKLRGFEDFEQFMANLPRQFEMIALDSVNNPQNLGMIIRSVSASPLRGLLLPRQGCAKLDSLVVKASAGALFKARIIRCDALAAALTALRARGADIVSLDLNAQMLLSGLADVPKRVFVLGNESQGIGANIKTACNSSVKIPMCNGIESLNVAVAAGLLAFRKVL